MRARAVGILQPKGITIVELLMVIAIIGILAGVGFVQYNKLIDDSRQAVAVSNLVAINRAQQGYYGQNSRFAGSLDALQLRFSDAYSYSIVTADAESFLAQAQYGSNVITINEKGALTYTTVTATAPASEPSSQPSSGPTSSPTSGPTSDSTPAPTPTPTPSPAPAPTPAPSPAPSPESSKEASPGKGPPPSAPGASKRP